MDAATYRTARERLLEQIDRLRGIRDGLQSRDPIFERKLPEDVRRKMALLDRDSARLRNPDLTIAVVGGFAAGKSTLVNAFLGRSLLPEGAKVTTAVPTFVRSTTGDERAELHYLDQSEVDDLEGLYRKEFAQEFNCPEFANAPSTSLVEDVGPLATSSGKAGSLLAQFRTFLDRKQGRSIGERGNVREISVAEARTAIQNEEEALFLDRVVLHVRSAGIPSDIVIVDLPGVGVPNPRHRQITFRFVKERAHAVVFVLNATQIFTEHDVKIVEAFRAGDDRVTEKTFWTINGWDRLSVPQREQTDEDFSRRMKEYSIPDGYQSFRTNALHGLLAELAIRARNPSRDEVTDDPGIQEHRKAYDAVLPTRYGGDHRVASEESQVPRLRERVLDFMNGKIRETTLRSAYDNARTNVCIPLEHRLLLEKEEADRFSAGGLNQQQAAEVANRTNATFQQRKNDIEDRTKELRDEVAVNGPLILLERNAELIEKIRESIESGDETDAFKVYLGIVGGGDLRKYPYYFEIEMRIVESLNSRFKQGFQDVVRKQVNEVFEQYVEKIDATMEAIGADVSYDAEVVNGLREIMRTGRQTFVQQVDGVVNSLAAELDALLVFEPASWFGLDPGNVLVYKLIDSAKDGYNFLKDRQRPITQSDFDAKTREIRTTLANQYLLAVQASHQKVANDFPVLVINNLHRIEQSIVGEMTGKYRPALQIVKQAEVEAEYGVKRQGLEQQSNRFRSLIDEVKKTAQSMEGILAAAKS